MLAPLLHWNLDAPGSPNTQPTQRDWFDRADSTTSLDVLDASDGRTWDAVVGVWGIASNQARLVTSAGTTNFALIGAGADGTFRADIISGNADLALTFRYVNPTNNLYIKAIGGFNGFELHKVVAGVDTLLEQWTGAPVREHIRVDCAGDQVTWFVGAGETQLGTYTITDHQTAQVAGFRGVGSTTVRIDSFQAPWGPVYQRGTVEAADIALLGLDLTGTPGALGTTAELAALTLEGLDLTGTPGAVSNALEFAALALTPQVPTITSTISAILQGAGIVLAGQNPAVTAGATTRTLEAAALLLAGQQPTITPGVTTRTVELAALILAGQTPTTTSPLTRALESAALVLAGNTPTYLLGPTSQTLTPAALILAGQTPAGTPGATTQTLAAAALILTGQVPTGTPAGVTYALQLAALILEGWPLSTGSGIPAQSGTLEFAALALAALALSATAGSTTLTLPVATLVLGAYSPTVTTAVTATLQVAGLTLLGYTPTTTAGTVTATFSVANITLTGQDIAGSGAVLFVPQGILTVEITTTRHGIEIVATVNTVEGTIVLHNAEIISAQHLIESVVNKATVEVG